MPWLAMVRMTFVADDQSERATAVRNERALANREPRRMVQGGA